MTARITGVPQAIAAVDAAIASLGKQWEVSLALPTAPREPYRTLRPRVRAPGPQPTNAEVIDHLTAMKRDPFALTLDDRAAVARTVVERFRGGLSGAALYSAVATTWRDRVVERMRAGNAAPPVSAAWAARKAKLGYPTTSSVASAQLLRAVASALPRVRSIR